MRYFYLKKAPGRQELDFDIATPNAPRSQKCLISPHEKQVNTKVTLVNANPDSTGNPSKNPQKHLKKPLPPVRCTADGREEGGWLGWLGWAGWVTAEAGLAGWLGWARLG